MIQTHLKKQTLVLGVLLLGIIAGAGAYVTLNTATTAPQAVTQEGVDSGQREVITLAGGCFWCTEAFFQEAPGVVDAISGYAGGEVSNASYKEVSKGTTAHREAVQVTYDPTRITTKEILDIYWGHIDPTDTDGQFADRGFQYTTAIYYHTDEQRAVAEVSKQALSDSSLFEKPIAPLILPYTTFFAAEEYHQDYYKKSADHYERYKKGSGRAGFIEENWAKAAALEFLAAEEANTSAQTLVYTGRTYTSAEIEAGLKLLPPDAYKVVAQEGTEPAYKNAYWNNKEEGIYVDVVTGRPLFSSKHKYDSNTGWPSFYQSLDGADLELKSDTLLIYERIEVRSESGHLGHVFDDGPKEHGGKRYCINSLALKFVPKADMEKLGYGSYMTEL